MKKIISSILFIILLSIISVIAFKTWQYCDVLKSIPPSKDGTSIYLVNSNYAVQIGYNIIYLTIALVVLGIAYFQLNKTREATTIQTLINIDYYIRSDDFLKKRRKLAAFVIDNRPENLSKWLNKIKNKKQHDLTTEEVEAISAIKNIFENVIYQFELVGHFYKKGIFSIEDVYQLFSIEIQQYWVLMQKLNFIQYLRENKPNPRKDYYDKFESLFHDTIKQEIINDSQLIFKPLLRVYYWFGIYRFFHFFKRKNRISTLIKQNEDIIHQFLSEEKTLLN